MTPRHRLAQGLGLSTLLVAVLALPALRPLPPLQLEGSTDRPRGAAASRGTLTPTEAAPLILLGDSITAAGPWSEAFPQRRVINAGIPGDTSVDLLARLDTLPSLPGATVVLMAGINDILQDQPTAAVADRLLAVRRGLLERGAARVVMVSTLPCEASRLGPRCLAPVAELNRSLQEQLAAADVLDLRPELSDAGGLRRSMGTDGLHLSQEAYQVWLRRLAAVL
jgi:lysophospholipase L1-like esterase